MLMTCIRLVVLLNVTSLARAQGTIIDRLDSDWGLLIRRGAGGGGGGGWRGPQCRMLILRNCNAPCRFFSISMSILE